jgi:phosphatidylserine synthase
MRYRYYWLKKDLPTRHRERMVAMRLVLPQEVRTRSRLVGAVATMVAFLILCAFLIPNMESGLVFITIFTLSGIAGVLSSGIVRYRARKQAFEQHRTLLRPTAFLTALAWTAVVLSAYSALVILNTWFLVPGDPAHTTAENILTKLKIMFAFGFALAGLITLARWSFKKRTQKREEIGREILD